jgi:hypothetical protein
MRNLKIFLLAFFLIIGLNLAVWFGGTSFWDKKISQPELHFHAGFQVYVDDHLQDFSNFKYMHTKPCSVNEEVEDEQIEKAHLHDGVGDVVHSHRDGGTYGDLFQNIKFSMSEDVVGYINGQQVPQVMKMQIVPNSSAVFFVGNNTDREKKVAVRVTQEHIREVESKSEDCGK